MGNTSQGWGKGNKGSVPDDHVPFVDFGEQDGPEVDRPDAVVGFFQADVVLFERVGDEEQLVFEPERARVRNALDQEVAGVLERRQAFGKRARRRGEAGAGRLAAPATRAVAPCCKGSESD